ncbi:MAG: magnesium chelatase [Anaerolineaceae bacterium]|nr:magnesium chelatase [Anaerolineaceae bacterium]
MTTQRPSSEPEKITSVGSLRELIDIVTGRAFKDQVEREDAGLAEVLPFPFLGLVGQEEMKLALITAVINPLVNGVLLVGPRGTGKTTIVRSLIDLLPSIQRSACHYGCLPEDIETSGIDAVCPDCARKYGMGMPLTKTDQGRLVELPLHARLEDLVAMWDERAMAEDRLVLKSGILKQADLNTLYIDEVNLLGDELINAILDASAQGTYTIRRGPLSNTYRARFTLIGSMNPEEGSLRPQIMDRFGLRVIVQGLKTPDERLEAYHRSRAYRLNPRATVAQYADPTSQARAEIEAARALLPQVIIPPAVEQVGTTLIQRLGIDSLRAEMTLFEAARAYAAADGRKETSLGDLRVVAPLALRLRQSPFMIQYFKDQNDAESQLSSILDAIIPPQEKNSYGEENEQP